MSEQEVTEEIKGEHVREPEEIEIKDSGDEFEKEKIMTDEIRVNDNVEKLNHIDECIPVQDEKQKLHYNIDNLNDLLITKDEQIVKLHLEIKEYQNTIILNEEQIKKDRETIDNLQKSLNLDENRQNFNPNSKYLVVLF
jgi:hypothetical protein